MSYNKEIIKTIDFHNNTDLPIILEFISKGYKGMPDIFVTDWLKIEPDMMLQVTSESGEWHIHTLHLEEDDISIWNKKGLNRMKYLMIGSFMSKPYINNNYALLEHDDLFECNYTENSGLNQRLITFTYK
jgi:hypothetical protein